MHAIISVLMKSRGDGLASTGKDVIVTANGRLIRAKSIKLEVKDSKATAILEVEVDEVQINEVLGKVS